MNRTLLIALGDVPTREIAATFFSAQGFICRCVDFDEKFLAHVDKFHPHAIITELVLKSRFFSPHDFDVASSLLLAARCKIPPIPIFLIDKDNSSTTRSRADALGMRYVFGYPIDLVAMLNQLRCELRRVSRLKSFHNIWPTFTNIPVGVTIERRGRPRKYPVAQGVLAGAAA